MSLATNLKELIEACFPGLWIQSHEHEDALAEISQLCREQSWQLATWDLAQGLSIAGQTSPAVTDPIAAIGALQSLAQPEGTAVLVLVNFHKLLQSGEVIQTLARQLELGKVNRTFVVILPIRAVDFFCGAGGSSWGAANRHPNDRNHSESGKPSDSVRHARNVYWEEVGRVPERARRR